MTSLGARENGARVEIRLSGRPAPWRQGRLVRMWRLRLDAIMCRAAVQRVALDGSTQHRMFHAGAASVGGPGRRDRAPANPSPVLIALPRGGDRQ